jgi:pyrimidine operon attenuation protein/uracil phosphoribosyltransferase
MDIQAVNRATARISHEIIERNQGVNNVCVLGVKKRGVPFAKRICDCIKNFEGVLVPFGELDITYHRDDLTEDKKFEVATESKIPCDLTGKTVIIVDDVVYTGRTVKASLETVFKYGRPNSVQFVALIDRGHRELPIRPDYVGKNVPTSKHETVSVELVEDGGVYIIKN